MLSYKVAAVVFFFFFFFNDTATTEIYTLSLHDALPICRHAGAGQIPRRAAMTIDALSGVLVIPALSACVLAALPGYRLTSVLNVVAALLTLLTALSLFVVRSEEHTSELQPRGLI